MSTRSFCIYLLSVFAQLIAIRAYSASGEFSNSYISFRVPENWNCGFEPPAWICRSKDLKTNQDAIILLVAKDVGPEDQLENYMQQLSTPFNQISMKTAKRFTSEVRIRPHLVQINRQSWVEALHFSSEVPQYFTRYLATVRGPTAILLTFSSHKDKTSQYSQMIQRLTSSLYVKDRKKPGRNNSGAASSCKPPLCDPNAVPPQQGGAWNDPMPVVGDSLTPPTLHHRRTNSIAWPLALLALLVGGLGVYLLKRKK